MNVKIQLHALLRKSLQINKTNFIMKTMRLFQSAILAMFLLNAFTAFGQKEKTVEVGGAPMYPSKDIVTNAVNSKDHTTLVAAVQAAGNTLFPKF